MIFFPRLPLLFSSLYKLCSDFFFFPLFRPSVRMLSSSLPGRSEMRREFRDRDAILSKLTAAENFGKGYYRFVLFSLSRNWKITFAKWFHLKVFFPRAQFSSSSFVNVWIFCFQFYREGLYFYKNNQSLSPVLLRVFPGWRWEKGGKVLLCRPKLVFF